ncbi:MAG: GGDEF domain-containing protein [bacterium]|nr:GGDEF domain-containing protein [bacterium]
MVVRIWDRLRGGIHGLVLGYEKSVTCPVTGVLKRDEISKIGEREVIRAKRYGRRLAVVVMDLDGFKLINDELGHLLGDVVLAEVGRVLLACLRVEDYVGRPGGDEFWLIFPETSIEGSEMAARRCMEAVRQKLEVVGFSYGVWGRMLDNSCDETFADFVRHADELMYDAKYRRSQQPKV